MLGLLLPCHGTAVELAVGTSAAAAPVVTAARQLRQQSDTSALRPSCCCCAILSRSGRDTLMQACKQLFCVACNACKPSMHVNAHEDHQQSNIEKGYTKRQLQPNGSSPPT